MNTNKTLIFIILGCFVAAAGIYGTAYLERQHVQKDQLATSTPSAKVASASVEDGTYVARVHSIMTSPEDTTITFTPVEYFDGDVATSTAEMDLSCDGQPIAVCAPTLIRGYYVRLGNEPDFTAPVTTDTKIVLHDNEAANITALKNMNRQFDPVFEVNIENGVVALLTEKSPL